MQISGSITNKGLGNHGKLSFLWQWLLIALVTLFPTTSLAESPWNWQMRLSVDIKGESMYMPSSVAFDTESERYYVVDTGKSRLVSFDRSGKFLRAFTANDQLQSPFDMVRLDDGRLWVVEKGRNSLTLIDVAGKKIEPISLKDDRQQIFPSHLAFEKGKLFVLDRSSGDILRLSDDQTIEQRYGCKECSAGLADFVFNDGALWALEPRDRKIFRFDPDGTIAKEIDLGEMVEFPVSLDIGPSGYFYVLDRHQNSVLVYDEMGRFRYSFLGSGQSPGNVYFASQVRFDPWGRLCVVDEGNGRVEIFSR